MPELPEVETVRRGLTSLIQGKTIAEVQVFWPKLIDLRPQETLAQWQDYLRGQTIQAVGQVLMAGFWSSGASFSFANGR